MNRFLRRHDLSAAVCTCTKTIEVSLDASNFLKDFIAFLYAKYLIIGFPFLWVDSKSAFHPSGGCSAKIFMTFAIPPGVSHGPI